MTGEFQCNGSTTINGRRRGRKPKNRGKIGKEKNHPHWLEPNEDDFRLVVDTVEGVRQLLMKYRDEDSVVMSRQSNNKVRYSHLTVKLLLYCNCLSLFIAFVT